MQQVTLDAVGDQEPVTIKVLPRQVVPRCNHADSEKCFIRRAVIEQYNLTSIAGFEDMLKVGLEIDTKADLDARITASYTTTE